MQKDGKKYNAEDKNILGHYTKEVGGDTQPFSQQKKKQTKTWAGKSLSFDETYETPK